MKCKRKGVFPQHLIRSFKCIHELLALDSPYLGKLNRLINRFRKSLMNLEIKQTFHSINKLSNNMQTIEQEMIAAMDNSLVIAFLDTQEKAYQRNIQNRNRSTNKKFQKALLATTQKPDALQKNERAILNATNIKIPDETLTLLSMGGKFSLPPVTLHQIPFYHLLADLERVVTTNSDKRVQDRNRCKAVNIIQNYTHGFSTQSDKNEPLNRFCSTARNTSAKFL